jgi:hypothetical protein
MAASVVRHSNIKRRMSALGHSLMLAYVLDLAEYEFSNRSHFSSPTPEQSGEFENQIEVIALWSATHATTTVGAFPQSKLKTCLEDQKWQI